MSDKLETRVIQVTNVAPSCTNEQLRTLFGYLGRVKELKAYPPENTEGAVARVSYIEFDDSVTCGVALHLSGTVFIDRALMVVPVMDGKIPDETTALQLTPQAVAGMLPGQPTWPANVVSQVTGTGINQVITTYDPRLTSLGLPQYPPLPITTDASKIEEIRRTVYVCDLDPKVTAEMLLSFFSQVGEIKYIRLAGDERAGARAAYIEFTDQRSVAQALTYNNVLFQGRTISVQHSKTSVVKPTGKANEASQREIDEAMKKVKEASKLISAAAGETKKDKSHSPSRKRSRSKSKQRSRSRSRSRRSRSRSKGRRRRSRSRTNRRSRSRHRSPRRSRSPRRRRSRSRGRVVPSVSSAPRRSRSRERRRSRTRSPVRRRRSRTRSRSRRRSRTPPRSYSKRSQSRSRRSSSRPKRRSRSRDRKEKTKEKKKSVSLSPPRLERNGSIPPRFDDGDKEDSPQKAESSPKASRTEGDSKPSAVTEGESGKASSKKRSPSPVKSRRRSPSPRKRSHSRSPSRRKRRRRTRSPSLRKKSRSRSGSRQRSKRERSKRSRSRDRKRESKKKVVKDKEDKKKDSISSKVKRDYDEEEKGFASGSDRNRDDSEPRSSGSPPPLEPEDKDSDHQPVDMDMSD